ncbi:hypothetical protein LOSG293_130220 [Secundilactobacillus oryzae JCM 18671]|uniref:Core domain-containing protein n=1 Tax=Secundilactobacillus oryzae JCM 18671 TaxID=1291743 RepID=A0A081BIG5_9LACO|nr:iron-sulfur cluster biosynthesis family protein [Secundilactobacillus oryzae]GAK47833.1 hypothetical protein LOSG293_130220 [Secundilactobacillus oryzae JCM 18671]
MIEFKMSADVVERLKRHSADQKNIVLDFDDGVGPYSAVGGCALDGGFKLLLVANEISGDDYEPLLDSPLGQVWVKKYSLGYFENEGPKLALNSNGMVQFSNNSGLVEANLEIVDDPAETEGIK